MLLSGGVDSSVELSLLASDPKYEVHAFYLKIWLEDELSHLGVCPWEEDWETCQKVVAHLSEYCSSRISLTAVSLQTQYHKINCNY
jgi:tRNA U34 2-thiouridine synthase MnmA/TrmU